jgi:hypothetical protein
MSTGTDEANDITEEESAEQVDASTSNTANAASKEDADDDRLETKDTPKVSGDVKNDLDGKDGSLDTKDDAEKMSIDPKGTTVEQDFKDKIKDTDKKDVKMAVPAKVGSHGDHQTELSMLRQENEIYKKVKLETEFNLASLREDTKASLKVLQQENAQLKHTVVAMDQLHDQSIRQKTQMLTQKLMEKSYTETHLARVQHENQQLRVRLSHVSREMITIKANVSREIDYIRANAVSAPGANKNPLLQAELESAKMIIDRLKTQIESMRLQKNAADILNQTAQKNTAVILNQQGSVAAVKRDEVLPEEAKTPSSILPKKSTAGLKKDVAGKKELPKNTAKKSENKSEQKVAAISANDKPPKKKTESKSPSVKHATKKSENKPKPKRVAKSTNHKESKRKAEAKSSPTRSSKRIRVSPRKK